MGNHILLQVITQINDNWFIYFNYAVNIYKKEAICVI
jgi:hypothetical protein